VVQKDKEESQKQNKTFYRFSLACRPGVRAHGPLLPSPALFEENEDTKKLAYDKIDKL